MSKTAAQLVAEGDDLLEDNKTAEAIVLYNQAIDLDSEFAEAYFSKANAMPGDSHEEKVILYRKAIDLGYVNSWTYNNYANSLMALNRLEEAIQALIKLINIDPGMMHLLSLIGNLSEQITNQVEAMRYYDLCLERRVAINTAACFKGKLLAQDGKFEEAIRAFEVSLNVGGNNIQKLYHTGNSYKALEQQDKALYYYNKAIVLQPDDADDWCYRGLAFIALGRREEGLEDLKKTKEKLASDYDVVYSPRILNFMRAIISSFLEVEEHDIAMK